jgi:hypothetical protein
MPTVSNAARITAKDGAVWRTCGGCGTLAALPPDIDRCTGCQLGADRAPAAGIAVELHAEHFAPGDLADISFAGCVFAAAVADIAHHEIGDPGVWDCYGTPPEELDRLRHALDRMQAAIRETRAQLAIVERRARRAARKGRPA